MELLISLYNLANTTMNIPTNYDPFHLTWVGIVILTSILLVCFFKNLNEKGVRIMAGSLWGLMVALEIGKQLIYSIWLVDGQFVWDYQWYAFPFQFCSSPLYVLPIVAFVKESKFRDAAITFLATFSLFAGLCVYVFPNDVFTEITFINYQTMIHHGAQIFFGVYLAFRYREKMTPKNLVWGTAVFSALAALAMAMDIGAHYIFPIYGIEETFNMFFISPYYECTLPVLSMVYAAVPYPVFLCIYIFGFMLCAGIIMLILKGFVKLGDLVERLVSRK